MVDEKNAEVSVVSYWTYKKCLGVLSLALYLFFLYLQIYESITISTGYFDLVRILSEWRLFKIEYPLGKCEIYLFFF